MTKNQIDYWNYRESKRHNEAGEEDTDLAREETVRHNKQQENIGYMQASAAQASASASMLNAQTNEAKWRQQKYLDLNQEERNREMHESQLAINAATMAKVSSDSELSAAKAAQTRKETQWLDDINNSVLYKNYGGVISGVASKLITK